MTALSYNQIALVPRYSTLRSRSEADVSVEFLGRRYALPVVPSNMQSVINPEIAHWLSENDHFYIMHRFGDTKAFVEKATRENWKTVSISIGVQPQDYQLIRDLDNWWDVDIDYVTIDVAHAHHVLVKDMLEFIKRRQVTTAQGHRLGPKIIAGNVATPEAVRDLAIWGADAVKVGIGQSKVCRTYHKTGFGLPMFTCIDQCSGSHSYQGYFDFERFGPSGRCPIIADSGVREIGDIAKSIVAGATMSMIGGLFAACSDAPGDNIYHDARQFGIDPKDTRPPTHKRMHGSASSRQKNKNRHVEGVELEIECNQMTIKELYQDIRESLQSACSYAGSTNLAGLKDVQYVEVK